MKDKNIFKFFIISSIIIIGMGTLSFTTICFGPDGHTRFELIKTFHLSHKFNIKLNKSSQNDTSVIEKFCFNRDDFPHFSHRTYFFKTDRSSFLQKEIIRYNFLFLVIYMPPATDSSLFVKSSGNFFHPAFSYLQSQIELII